MGDRIISGNELARLDGKRIALFAYFALPGFQPAQKLVTAENAGNDPLNATRDDIGPWETFVIRVMGNDSVALRAVNNNYVTAENAGIDALIARQPNPGLWESFQIVQWSANATEYGLKAVVNGLYVGVDMRTQKLFADGKFYGLGDIFNIVWLDIDLVQAFQAFAINFPGKVKGHTIGRLSPPNPPHPGEDGHGVLFISERIEKRKLWIYWAYPKWDPKAWPLGYQHVWDGILVESDGYISADCTIPEGMQGAVWTPPIPRTHRNQPLGRDVQTKHVNCLTTVIGVSNNPISQSSDDVYGIVNAPEFIDLSDSTSEENMGWRWVLAIGIKYGPERWYFDLGPQVGVFQPRYGCVGYGDANDANDISYCASIQTKTFNASRRYDGTPQP